MEKGGQKGTHRVPSGIVGVVFEVGMKWEWVEGAWGTYQCACSLDYSIQFVLPFSLLLPFKWQHGSGWYLFLIASVSYRSILLLTCMLGPCFNKHKINASYRCTPSVLLVWD